MYCRHCGQEIEPMVICNKCGCASGYVEPTKPRETVKIKNLPVKILSAVGILVLLIVLLQDLRIISANPSANLPYLLVDVIGIAALVSLICDKFKKIKIAYPIALLVREFIPFLLCRNVKEFFSMVFTLTALVLLINYMSKTKKVLGIASIALASINYLADLIDVIKLHMAGYHISINFVIGNDLAVLLFAIAIFLYIKSEIPKSEVKNTEVSL